MDTTLESNSMCRICLNHHNTLISIFSDIAFSSYSNLNDKLENTNLNIDLSIGPTLICCTCLTELEATVKFLDKCKKSNGVLESQSVEALKDTYIESSQLDEEEENAELSRLAEEGSEVEAPAEIVLVKCVECGSRRRCDHWAPPRAFVCHHCQKVFTRKFNFKLHLKRHLDWPCAVCGVRQMTQWLARHHCGPKKRRQCSVDGCTKSFTTNTNLNSHIRSHFGKRPYECKECGKTFNTRTILINHERIHTGVKPFMCPICGRQFATNKLAAHMRAHRGEAKERTKRKDGPAAAPAKTHACPHCPAAYVHRQSLNKHLRLLHADTAAAN